MKFSEMYNLDSVFMNKNLKIHYSLELSEETIVLEKDNSEFVLIETDFETIHNIYEMFFRSSFVFMKTGKHEYIQTFILNTNDITVEINLHSDDKYILFNYDDEEDSLKLTKEEFDILNSFLRTSHRL